MGQILQDYLFFQILLQTRDLDWSESGVEGSWKYLKRLNTFFKNKDFSNNKIIPNEALSKEALNLKKEIHSLIKLTTENFDTFRFNSAVANIRKLSNLILENDKKTSEYD